MSLILNRTKTAEFNYTFVNGSFTNYIEDGVSIDEEGCRFSIGSDDMAEAGHLSSQIFMFTESSVQPTHLLSSVKVDPNTSIETANFPRRDSRFETSEILNTLQAIRDDLAQGADELMSSHEQLKLKMAKMEESKNDLMLSCSLPSSPNFTHPHSPETSPFTKAFKPSGKTTTRHSKSQADVVASFSTNTKQIFSEEDLSVDPP
mmetsp:Transcript_24361/g.37726  ORF Transcript_24361/g.37726 Transcript_24361/m.37726 type:complete len:204 (-) Transcript_24361:1195-1806(-)